MQRGIAWYLVAPLIALGLVGCRVFDYEEREPWRAEAEEQCLAQRLVQPTDHLTPSDPVNGKGTCGMTKPFKVAAVSGGFVEFKPKATLSCPLVANVEAWFHEAIQPAAMAWYGSPIIEIKQISAYSCRTMNGQPGTPISEHSFGNALDIASFRFADGREVDFKSGWKGKPEERGFLRAVHAGACERFSTVLAPGSNAFHYDHIHVDLARRASGRKVCNPAPMTMPAPPPRYPESVPMARAPSQQQPVVQASRSGPRDATSPWAKSGAAEGLGSGPERGARTGGRRARRADACGSRAAARARQPRTRQSGIRQSRIWQSGAAAALLRRAGAACTTRSRLARHSAARRADACACVGSGATESIRPRSARTHSERAYRRRRDGDGVDPGKEIGRKEKGRA
jgi:hypothetical protein